MLHLVVKRGYHLANKNFHRGIFSYNDGHIVLRNFDTIPIFLFTTSEAKRDC